VINTLNYLRLRTGMNFLLAINLRFDMLELQELLVRGGFIDPKEAL
jgi:hypothetical protein